MRHTSCHLIMIPYYRPCSREAKAAALHKLGAHSVGALRPSDARNGATKRKKDKHTNGRDHTAADADWSGNENNRAELHADGSGSGSADDGGEWLWLLDAAKLCATAPLDVRNCRIPPHFVCVSFYKMFGYPTGLGALLVHKRIGRHPLHPLQRNKVFYGGGTYFHNRTISVRFICSLVQVSLSQSLFSKLFRFNASFATFFFDWPRPRRHGVGGSGRFLVPRAPVSAEHPSPCGARRRHRRLLRNRRVEARDDVHCRPRRHAGRAETRLRPHSLPRPGHGSADAPLIAPFMPAVRTTCPNPIVSAIFRPNPSLFPGISSKIINTSTPPPPPTSLPTIVCREPDTAITRPRRHRLRDRWWRSTCSGRTGRP